MVRFLLIFFSMIMGIGAQEIPQKQDWSFAGPFGLYDKAQLQRGLQVYSQICSSCHSLKFMTFRDLTALGYDTQDILTFAAQYQKEDGSNAQGEMFERTSGLSDGFPASFANAGQAALANGGAIPVDLSLIARARGIDRPFPGFISDIFTNYTAAGPDYIYALLTGYRPTTEGQEPPPGLYNNPYFIAAPFIAMAAPLDEGRVLYEDGTPPTLENYARDVAAFLMWTADPHMELRKKTGFRVLVFLTIFSLLLYLLKRQIWRLSPKKL